MGPLDEFMSKWTCINYWKNDSIGLQREYAQAVGGRGVWEKMTQDTITKIVDGLPKYPTEISGVRASMLTIQGVEL